MATVEGTGDMMAKVWVADTYRGAVAYTTPGAAEAHVRLAREHNDDDATVIEMALLEDLSPRTEVFQVRFDRERADSRPGDWPKAEWRMLWSCFDQEQIDKLPLVESDTRHIRTVAVQPGKAKAMFRRALEDEGIEHPLPWD